MYVTILDVALILLEKRYREIHALQIKIEKMSRAGSWSVKEI